MNNKLLDILQTNEVPIDNQQLIDYLKGDLNKADMHQLEAHEMDDAMLSDAMEGLKSIQDTTRLELMAKDINITLQKKLAAQKNKHKETRKWKDQSWILAAIGTVLLLAIICYLFMKVIFQ